MNTVKKTTGKLGEKIASNFLQKNGYSVTYDESGSIGRRYRRIDERGTPYAVTVDHQSLEDNTVTLRERDSMKQTRIKISMMTDHLKELFR